MKAILLKHSIFILLLFFSIGSFCQYPFYFSSGNFNPPNSWAQGNAVRMGTVANTNIQTDTATAVGVCYFRFYSAQSGGTNYAPAETSDISIPLNQPFALEVEGASNKAYYFGTENLTDNYIFKTDGSGAPGNARAAVIRVQGPVQSITGISQFPGGDVYAGQDVNIYATLSGAFSPGQGAYLRWTTDNWSSSTVVEMTDGGTQYWATIPGAVNTVGVNLNYYVFTSGDSLNIAPADADLMTINLFNNNFANFTYVPQCPLTLSNAFFDLVETDKARYNPGDSVNMEVSFIDTIQTSNSFDTALTARLVVTYWHLDSVFEHAIYTLGNVINFSWSWHPPTTDYTGYMVQLRLIQNNVVTDSTTIAIDVSSDWKKYPRYGFISAYPWTDSVNQKLLFNSLNRYHLNGLQFYDVNHEHHKPLAGTVQQPDTIWNDVANRATYLSTVNAYIGLAHNCNMMAMNYNLLYGAYTNTAVADGVLPQWGIYSDQSHQNIVTYTLPASWASNLQVENPADTGWQHYLFANERNLFQAIPFDGWHVDQLGSQGAVYDYDGNPVNLAGAFGTYLQNASSALGVPLVMNAVTNYGQQEIATAPVQFLYTEVWPPFTSYNDLAGLIDSNRLYSNNALSTVLAAYMDQGISGNLGSFNTPAVLFTDAAIFASGGSHIEMGDHLLCNPYFPNSNLSMSCGLQENLVKYYDFMVGYENLLRDSISASSVVLQITGSNALSTIATTGKIWVISKEKTNTDIFHLINFVNANTINWNDPNDNQTAPNIIQNIPLSFTSTQILPVKRIYIVSPDINNGLPQQLVFMQVGSTVSFTLPTLSYWSTIVVEYGVVVNSVANIANSTTVTAYPNPFAGQVNFGIQAANAGLANISITDELGRVVTQIDNYTLTGGTQLLNLPFADKPQGVYLWWVNITDVNGKPIDKQQGKLVHL